MLTKITKICNIIEENIAFIDNTIKYNNQWWWKYISFYSHINSNVYDSNYESITNMNNTNVLISNGTIELSEYSTL